MSHTKDPLAMYRQQLLSGEQPATFADELARFRDLAILYGDYATDLVRLPHMYAGALSNILAKKSTLPRELREASILNRASAGAEAGVRRLERDVPLLGPVTREIREAGEGARERLDLPMWMEMLIGAMVPPFGVKRPPKPHARGALKKVPYATGERQRLPEILAPRKESGEIGAQFIQGRWVTEPSEIRLTRGLEGPIGAAAAGEKGGPGMHRYLFDQYQASEAEYLIDLVHNGPQLNAEMQRRLVEQIRETRIHQMGNMRLMGKSPNNYYELPNRPSLPEEYQETLGHLLEEEVSRGNLTMSEAYGILAPGEDAARDVLDVSKLHPTSGELAEMMTALKDQVKRAQSEHNAIRRRFESDEPGTRLASEIERVADKLADIRINTAASVEDNPAWFAPRGTWEGAKEWDRPMGIAAPTYEPIEGEALQRAVGKRIAKAVEDGALPVDAAKEFTGGVHMESEPYLLEELSRIGIVSDVDWEKGGGRLQ